MNLKNKIVYALFLTFAFIMVAFNSTLAAADPEILQAVGYGSTAITENVTESFYAIIPLLVLATVFITTTYIVIRLAKRISK